MKRSFLYLLVGCLSFGGLGGGTFLYLNGSQETPPSTTMPDDDDDDILESVEQTPQDKFMTNLLASNLKVNKLDVGVNVGGENIAVSFTGALSYDGKELAQGNFEAISASGDLNLKVMDFDETINFSFPGDNTLYFSYMEKDFSISIGSITSIIDLIPLFTTPAVAEEQLNETTAANIKKAAGLDIGSLLNDLTDMLNNIQATETTTGYDFLLEIPDLVSIVLSSDKDFMLTGIKLVNPIEIEGITITLDADVQAYKDQSFVEGPTGEYQSLDTITNIVSTLTDIMETKKLTAKLDVSAHSLSDDSLDLNVKARLSADVNNVTDDFLKGTYELSILPEGILQGNPQPNSVDIRYEHENIYLKVNELLKVKIQNQTLEDVISTVGEYFGTSESTEATDDLLNNLFGGSILMDLIEGDFTGIKSSIKDFNSYPEKLEITFAPEFLNSAKEWSIALNFAEKELKSISIIDFTIADFEIDLNLELQKSFVTTAIFDDLSSFQDFKAGASIFKTIAKIIDSKQFLTDFEINLKHKTDLFAFEGEIGADLNGVDFNNIETLLNGTFKISANAKYGEKHKAVSAQLQDQTLYVNFNEILRNSIKGSSITDLIDFITENFGAISLGDSTFDINQIFELLALNAEEYSKIVEQVTKFDFTGLDDYVLINHNNKDDNKITVKILPNKTARTYIYIELATDSKELTHISINDLRIGEAYIDLKLNIKDFSDLRIVDTSTYQPLDNLLTNFTKLVGATKLNLKVDASIVDSDPSASPILLDADLQLNNETTEFFGDINLSAKLPTDTSTYNHHITVDNYVVGNDKENEILMRYYGNNNSKNPLRVFIADGEFGRMLDVITNIPEDNSLMFLASLATDLTISMPLLDIINGEYGKIFDDYLTVFNVGTNKVEIVIDGSLFAIDTEIRLEIEYDTEGVNSLSIKDLTFGSMTINATIGFGAYDESKEAHRLHITEPKYSVSYINFNYLDLFLNIVINTTQSRRYHLLGDFNLTLPQWISSIISNIAIYSSVDMKLVISDVDGSVNAIITILNKKANGAYGENENGYRKTEFFIQSNNDCIIKQTRVTGSWFTTYRETDIFRVTQAEMVNNLIYYLLKYTFNMNDLIFDPINDAILNPSTDDSGEANNILNFKYENIISQLSYNVDEYKFSLTLDLNNIIRLENVAGVLTQDKISISFTHNENYVLRGLRIEGEPIKVEVLGSAIPLGIYLDVINNTNEFSMDYFDEFTRQYYSNSTLVNLGYYEYRTGNTEAIYTQSTRI